MKITTGSTGDLKTHLDAVSKFGIEKYVELYGYTLLDGSIVSQRNGMDDHSAQMATCWQDISVDDNGFEFVKHIQDDSFVDEYDQEYIDYVANNFYGDELTIINDFEPYYKEL